MTDLERQPALERALLIGRVNDEHQGAAHELVDFAHQRAHPGPVLMAGDRSLKLDAREELADLANYGTWAHIAGEISPADLAAAGQLLAELWAIFRD